MPHRRLACAALPVAALLWPLGSALAQLPASAPAQAPAGNEAPYAHELEGRQTIRANHTAEFLVTQRFKILSQSAIATVSQQKLTFVDDAQTLTIIEAYTQKPDGRRIPVAPSSILTQDAFSGDSLIYNRNLKQRTVIFPDVAVGDTLALTYRDETPKGKTFKYFTNSQVFPRSSAYSSIKLTVDAPAALHVRVKATGKGAVESTSTAGGNERHTIVITPEPYLPEETGAVAAIDRSPGVFVSTYKSYEELGSTFGQAALPKAAVTPAITALANEITKGIDDKRAQAAAIDAWMKKNIRYVAVLLGAGRTVPNEAATVLKNRFGDCKDKATLMSALLAAKGIPSELVLIYLGNAYSLPEAPTIAGFNHVILYLPQFDLYDDPTANYAAFGVLALQAYDKPVVRVAAGGARLARTPAMKPEEHTVSARTVIDVAADGTVSGRTEETGTGALGAVLRAGIAEAQRLGNETAARRRLQAYFTPGSGHFELGDITETTDPVVVRSTFTLDDRFKPPGLNARATLSHGLPLAAWPGNFLLGTRLNGRQAPFVCYAGRETEDLEITFDPAWPVPVRFLPVNIDNPAFTYRASMTIEGRTLKSHREFVSRVEREVCSPELEAQIADDMTKVRTHVYSGYLFQNIPAARPANAPTGGPDPAGAIASLPPGNPAAPNPSATQGPPPSAAAAANRGQEVELTRVTAAEQKIRIAFFSALEPDCSSAGETTVRVAERPQHGKLTIENGQAFTNFPKDNQRFECNTRKSGGTLVFYQPEAGYAGPDSIRLEVIGPRGDLFRRHYSIEVK
jgi:transglutaminase-like putative cysteine protease